MRIQTDRQAATSVYSARKVELLAINQSAYLTSTGWSVCLFIEWFVLHVPLPYPTPLQPTPPHAIHVYRDVIDVTQPTECRCVVQSSHSSECALCNGGEVSLPYLLQIFRNWNFRRVALSLTLCLSSDQIRSAVRVTALFFSSSLLLFTYQSSS